MSSYPKIFYLEDSLDDFFTVHRIVKRWSSANVPHTLVHFQENQAIFDALREFPEGPGIFLVDLNLGSQSGLTFLSRLQRSTKLSTPRIVLSSSRNQDDISGAYEAGANGYVHKPVDPHLFEANLFTCFDYWLRVVEKRVRSAG